MRGRSVEIKVPRENDMNMKRVEEMETSLSVVTHATSPFCHGNIQKFNKLLLTRAYLDKHFSAVVSLLLSSPEVVSLASVPLCSHSSSDFLWPAAAFTEGVCFRETV